MCNVLLLQLLFKTLGLSQKSEDNFGNSRYRTWETGSFLKNNKNSTISYFSINNKKSHLEFLILKFKIRLIFFRIYYKIEKRDVHGTSLILKSYDV